MIERKAQGKEIAVQPEPEEAAAPAPDLMGALKASLEAVKAREGDDGEPAKAKRKAPAKAAAKKEAAKKAPKSAGKAGGKGAGSKAGASGKRSGAKATAKR
jgi:DNA end-binding protein Ku